MSDLVASKTFYKRHALSISLAELSPICDYYDMNAKEGERWLYFARLSVPPKERGKGVATELMNELVAWAKEEQVNILCQVNAYGDLDTEQLTNFYKKFGFVDHAHGLVLKTSE